ncbi:LysR family transcriptional regulator [Maricurvus nonylphenolicus]|uniref:LysR family transcriptional regulator n=1 Tax=Maricurvus nonylphenolicus TaxID=1008307 RepID=UPI0036F3E1BE
MITIKQLQHLLAIIEHGSIHSAAESLFLTHTAVTRSLNKLEDDLGVSLFERSKSGMQPTAFCLQIVDSCRKVLVDVGDIKREAEIYQNLSGGELRIAVGRAARSLILRDTLPVFHARYPAIAINITENTPEYLTESLHGRELDLLLAGSGSYRNSEGLAIELLCNIPMSIIVREGHPLIAESEHDANAFFNYPLVAPTMIGESHPLYPLMKLKQEHGGQGVGQWPSIMCSDYPTIENVIRTSDAISIAPVMEFSQQLQQGSLVSLDFSDRQMNLELSVIEVENRMRSPAAQAFIDICKAHFSGV